MEQRPLVTITIGRRHVAIILVALCIALVAGGLLVGYASGANLPLIGGSPTPTKTRVVRYSVPSGPLNTGIDWQATREAQEARRRQECDAEWRSYLVKYTDYQAGKGRIAPMKPMC